MKGRMKRRGELIVIPGSPLPIVDEDPGKMLTRASLPYIISNGGNSDYIQSVSTVHNHGPAGQPGALPEPGGAAATTRPVHSLINARGGNRGDISAKPCICLGSVQEWTRGQSLSSRGIETGQPDGCLFPQASRTGARGTENRSEREA